MQVTRPVREVTVLCATAYAAVVMHNAVSRLAGAQLRSIKDANQLAQPGKKTLNTSVIKMGQWFEGGRGGV